MHDIYLYIHRYILQTANSNIKKKAEDTNHSECYLQNNDLITANLFDKQHLSCSSLKKGFLEINIPWLTKVKKKKEEKEWVQT